MSTGPVCSVCGQNGGHANEKQRRMLVQSVLWRGSGTSLVFRGDSSQAEERGLHGDKGKVRVCPVGGLWAGGAGGTD